MLIVEIPSAILNTIDSDNETIMHLAMGLEDRTHLPCCTKVCLMVNVPPVLIFRIKLITRLKLRYRDKND